MTVAFALPDNSGAGVAPVHRAEFREALARLEAIEKTMLRVQALAARTFEAFRDEPTLLAAARGADDYEGAFSGEPLVSVRIATFNGVELLVNRALPSLLAQTYENWECHVVGDATEDDTGERLAALGDPRIRFMNLPVRGPYPAEPEERWFCAGTQPANEGIRVARGRWIAALDHDDAWDPDHLEVLLGHAQATRAEVVYGRIRVTDAVTSAPIGTMGQWPPVRGEFGFLSSLVHSSLRFFEYDFSARFAGEPGDWNLVRRMWESGVRFAFLGRETATHFFTARHDERLPVDRTLLELRQWVEELDALRLSQIGELEARNAALEEQLAHERRAFEMRLDALMQSRPRRLGRRRGGAE